MKETGRQLSLKERGIGSFTFIDIDVRNPSALEFRIPKSIIDHETNLPHVIYENGEHLPHPQFAAEILSLISS